MNILFYRYGSICEPDILSSFLELGNSVTEITEEIENKNITPAESVQLISESLFKHDYHFVFTVNFFPAISDVCNIFNIRYVCWTVDCPVLELYSASIKNPWNRIFLFDYAQYSEFASYNPDYIFYLPLASNPTRWTNTINQASYKDVERFSSDISFVGSLYTEKCLYDNVKNLPDYLSGYLDGIMSMQQKIYGYNFLEEVLSDDIVKEFCNYCPDFYRSSDHFFPTDRSILAWNYLGPKITANERLHLLQLLSSQYSVNLYTGSDTSNLSVRNCGRVKTLTEMPLIFHYSKINLNFTAKSIRSGLPLRIFDILGCEGFLLTNYQTELAEYFSPGVDLDYYSSEEDLLTKVEYYLSHPKIRSEIAQNGFERIKNEHTYTQRLLKMISLAFGLS